MKRFLKNMFGIHRANPPTRSRHPRWASRPLALEELEARQLLSGVTSPPPIGLTPNQVRHAYGFDRITLDHGIAGDGTGQTIAIVDAFDDPNIEDDLHAFDQRFNL